MKRLCIVLFFLTTTSLLAQNRMTPELLWQLGRVSAVGISRDGKQMVYTVSTPSISENKSKVRRYAIPLNGGAAYETEETLVDDKSLSPD